jgi:hypothetical protein
MMKGFRSAMALAYFHAERGGKHSFLDVKTPDV